jgi:transposase InsO family protein
MLNNKEPMLASELPDRPSSTLAADLFQHKCEHYLLTVNYFSKWSKIDKLDELSSSNVICYFKKHISRFGYIDMLITDNGPQFASGEFAKFAKEYGFIHITTSPHFSQANGQAERFVQTAKNLIKKSKDPSIGIHC